MKKLILLIAALSFMTTQILAQTGLFYAGLLGFSLTAGIHSDVDESTIGNPNFQTTTNDQTVNKTKFGLSGAYFLNDNWNVGLSVRYSTENDEQVNGTTNSQGVYSGTTVTMKEGAFSIGAIGGWYSNNTGPLGISINGRAGIKTGSSENENSTSSGGNVISYGTDKFNIKGFYAGVAPSVYAKVSPSLILKVKAGGLKYHNTDYEIDSATNNGMSVDLGDYIDDTTEKGLWFDVNPRNYMFSVTWLLNQGQTD